MTEKRKVQFICQNCQAPYSRWQGKCDSCETWNSIQEEVILSKSDIRATQLVKTAIPISAVKVYPEETISSYFREVDRVLGTGFVKGSVCLLGGEPGIGKSTLSLQLAQKIAATGHKVLYISGEESASQLFLRAKRLGPNPPSLLILVETDMADILTVIRTEKPDFVILDSIQVMAHPDLTSPTGSISQVRYCTSELIKWIKELGSCALVIGHITKDGSLAGPKVLEHLVDVILFFEGEPNQQYRILRCFKNRYASTAEIGIFQMVASGLAEILKPSELFIDEVTFQNPGSSIVPILEGNRALLVELQALVVDSGYGMAKRSFLGVDSNRASLMIATMEKLLRVKLGGKDIFLNIVGGFKLSEPGLDLGIILSIASSLFEKSMTAKIGVIGEVGLTGEIRAVGNIEKRITELQNMGFSACLLPEKNRKNFPAKATIQPYYVNHIRDAVTRFLGE